MMIQNKQNVGLSGVPRNIAFSSPSISVTEPYQGLWSRKIQGVVRLAPGYTYELVPKDAEFEEDPKRPTELAYNYNVLKILASVAQTVIATVTLYETRGDQIDRYGYAAFGLTVTPYAMMSLVNLLGHSLCPEYETMYFVETAALRKMLLECTEIDNEGKWSPRLVDGVIGRMKETPSQTTAQSKDASGIELEEFGRTAREDGYGVLADEPPQSEQADVAKKSTSEDKPISRGRKTFNTIICLPMFFVVIPIMFFWPIIPPLAIMGALTHFQKGSSTHSQRAWLMCWLVFGQAASLMFYVLRGVFDPAAPDNLGPDLNDFGRDLRSFTLTVMFILAFLAGIPSIGGLVVVGKMLSDYGACIRVA